MALKRKRSSPTFGSSPFTTFTNTTTETSPLPFFYTQSKPIEALYSKPTWSFPTYSDDDSHTQYSDPVETKPSSRDLNSRTRKRHRDDRPDEESVYGAS